MLGPARRTLRLDSAQAPSLCGTPRSPPQSVPVCRPRFPPACAALLPQKLPARPSTASRVRRSWMLGLSYLKKLVGTDVGNRLLLPCGPHNLHPTFFSPTPTEI